MVGNKAQKAVAAALTGLLAFGGIAPAFAGTWVDSDNPGKSWFRINGDHYESYTLGTYYVDDDGVVTTESGQVLGDDIIKGENRYDTMFDSINYNVSKKQVWKQGEIKEVVLASGESQADSLVAAGLAGTLNVPAVPEGQETKPTPLGSPVITTPGKKLGTQAERAIRYYAKGLDGEKDKKLKVYIVGGEAAVSKDVEDAIEDIVVQNNNKKKIEVEVKRVAGENRVETSMEVAKQNDKKHLFDDDLNETTNAIFIANGKAWPDALSVSSFSYLWGRPILLTDADGKLSDEQLEYLKKQDESVSIYVIGGPALPSVDQLYDNGFDQAEVRYVGGKDRYETSAAVIKRLVDVPGRDGYAAIAVASGTEAHWADALIGGPFVGANKGILALVDGEDQVVALKAAYDAMKKAQNKGTTQEATTGNANAFIMGGTAAIDQDFAEDINDDFPVVEQN